MTETKREPVVPEGKDALFGLSVRELSEISRAIKCDVMMAIGQDVDGKRIEAFAHVAWKWEQRTNPKAKLTPYFELGYQDLMRLVRFDDEDEPAGEEPENPTQPSSESE